MIEAGFDYYTLTWAEESVLDGGFGLRQACLYSILKFDIGDEFWQQVLSVETSPRFLCALDELAHHGKGGLVR